MNEITEMLDRLANLRFGVDAINLRFDELRDSVLTPEIRQALEDIEAERAASIEPTKEAIAELENKVKGAVIANGETVKGEFLQAVYSKPRVSWDTKALDGYAAAHPEIAAFRKEGSPSVSIRVVK